VGLPLAVEFGKVYQTFGFDQNIARIEELRQGTDSTLEVFGEELQAARFLDFTTDSEAIRDCNVFIVAVPTPIDAAKRPNFKPLEGASRTVAKVLKPGDVVIFESTRRGRHQEDDQKRYRHREGQDPDHRVDLQGELPRPAQHAG